MSNPYLKKYIIWRVPLGKRHELRRVHASFTDCEERDDELKRLREEQVDTTWLAQNPLDNERTDGRRTL